MTTGTKIVQEALQNIGAHSVINPASPESIQAGIDRLNGMIAEWQDNSIDMGCVPLKNPGDELSEPLGAKNAIVDNLSLQLHPKFPGSQISPELKANAMKGYNEIARRWKPVVIPKRQVRSTLPLGQGNKTLHGNAFFQEDQEIG